MIKRGFKQQIIISIIQILILLKKSASKWEARANK